MPLARGDAVSVEMTKWGDRPHSAFTGTYLGEDEHGAWVGARAGTRCLRSGNRYAARSDWVTLLPETDWWRAGFYADPPTEVYVDIATPSAWTGATVTCVDLDLDVVRQTGGEVLVADEDEFAEHRESLGYPADVVDRATDALLRAREALASAAAPFDGAHARWFATLDQVEPA